jgi:LuxR family maltose regulon positive regulatory protein
LPSRGDKLAADALLLRLQTLSQTEAAGGYIALSQSRLLIAAGEPLAAARLLDTLAGVRESSGEWLFAVRLRLRQALPSGVPASGSRRWLSADRACARCIRGCGAACWRREEMAALLAEIHKRGAADDALTADIAALLSRFAAAGIVIDSASAAARAAADRTGAADPAFDCRRLFQ